jgi:hypothetical protein
MMHYVYSRFCLFSTMLRASFRCLQRVSFRELSNTRSTRRFNARMTPIRANIVGPSLLRDRKFARWREFWFQN